MCSIYVHVSDPICSLYLLEATLMLSKLSICQEELGPGSFTKISPLVHFTSKYELHSVSQCPPLSLLAYHA